MNDVVNFFKQLFNSSDWPPRWHCGKWTGFHGWLYIISDLLIWSAYFAIPIVIISYISRKQDTRFIRLYFLFAAFILACGATHFFDALSFWIPVYRLNALLLFITGLLSWVTVFCIIRYLPLAVSLRPLQDLEKEIEQRKKAEDRFRRLNAELDRKIIERTAEISDYKYALDESSIVAITDQSGIIVNRELEAFTYSVSHDLRAPLRIISGFADILTTDFGDKLNSEGNRILGVIMTNARRMGQLIDDLLNLSRLGRQEIVMSWVDMNDLVNSAIDEQLPLYDSKDPKIECDRLLPASCDSSLIRQVWINLISNALKYSGKQGNPAIHINSYRDGNKIVYSVKDNGVGFDMKYAGKLFGVFQRLHKIAEFEGTGVGLALVQRIIIKHGGQVWAESEPGKGAAFFFSLPGRN